MNLNLSERFLSILTKHSDYLVVSGFVSICSGRTRATEDVDVLVPVMEREKFEKLFYNLIEQGFWCYQGDSVGEVYSFIEKISNIRFAEKDTMYPNIEFIPINETKRAQFFEFTHPQKIRIKEFDFKIPPIEFEILYKEIVLKGDKNIADARHLRTFFKDIIKEERFNDYEPIIKEVMK